MATGASFAAVLFWEVLVKELEMKTTAPCEQALTMCLWRPVRAEARMDATLHQASSQFPLHLILLASQSHFFSIFLSSEVFGLLEHFWSIDQSVENQTFHIWRKSSNAS